MRIGEAATGIGEQMADTGLAIERAQDKTEQMQARAAAVEELIAAGTLEDFTAGDQIAARPRARADLRRPAGRRRARGPEGRGRRGRREEGARAVIVRLMGEGQYRIDDGCGAAERARRRASGGDRGRRRAEARRGPRRDVGARRGRGEKLPDDDLSASDLVIPPSDLTLEETKKLFSDDGLVPDLPSVSGDGGLVHWDDVEPQRDDEGHFGFAVRRLGRAAGCVEVTVNRAEISPGRWSTPAHVEDEEIFYVLGGSGLSWQDGEVYEVREGDCIVHRARKEAHTLRAGDDGLDVLAFGRTGGDGHATLPRAGVTWLGSSWVASGAGDHPGTRRWRRGSPRSASRRSGCRRSSTSPTSSRIAGSTSRDAAGSVKSGLNVVTVAPAKLPAPAHCHSAEEEIFVILEGDGTLELVPSPRSRRPGKRGAASPRRAGHVVARPAGTQISHAFRGGENGMKLLMYAVASTNDITYYPRSNKIGFRGIGLMTRLEPLDYWDGEPARNPRSGRRRPEPHRDVGLDRKLFLHLRLQLQLLRVVAVSLADWHEGPERAALVAVDPVDRLRALELEDRREELRPEAALGELRPDEVNSRDEILELVVSHDEPLEAEVVGRALDARVRLARPRARAAPASRSRPGRTRPPKAA